MYHTGPQPIGQPDSSLHRTPSGLTEGPCFGNRRRKRPRQDGTRNSLSPGFEEARPPSVGSPPPETAGKVPRSQAPMRASGKPSPRCSAAPPATLHGALPAGQARPLVRRSSSRFSPPPSTRCSRPRTPGKPVERLAGVAEAVGADGAQGGAPAASGRRRTARLHGVPARPLVEAALDQPAGARQPRDRAPQQGRRYLPRTTLPWCASPERCSWSRTTNGWRAGATSPSSCSGGSTRQARQEPDEVSAVAASTTQKRDCPSLSLSDTPTIGI